MIINFFLGILILFTPLLYAKKEIPMIGVIFDCDGTLVNSEGLHFLSWQEAFSKEGVIITEEQYYPFSGHSGIYVAQKLYQGASIALATKIYLDKKRIYRGLCKQEIDPIERTVSFVRQLAERKQELGIKLAVASAAPKKEILNHLKNLGLLSVFDEVVSGSDDLHAHYRDPEGINKPKPYIYLHAAKLLGLEPSQCIAFEDSHTGVISAATAGLITFAVPNIYTQEHDFSRAMFVIDPSTAIDMEDFFQKIEGLFVKKDPVLVEDLISFEK